MLITLFCQRLGLSFILVVFIARLQIAYCEKQRVRGIDPAYGLFYIPDHDGQFNCLDGRKKILFSRVNDDYCDCLDGSDEPGTSACANDDGICDCCDGSDESSPTITCPNTCKEQGQQVLDTFHKDLAAVELGLSQREKYIKDAIKLKSKWKSQLQKAVKDIAKKQQQVDSVASRKSELEKREQQLKELQKKATQPQEKSTEQTGEDAAVPAAAGNTPPPPPTQPSPGTPPTSIEGESAEEQAKRVAAQWIPGAGQKEDDPLDVPEYDDDEDLYEDEAEEEEEKEEGEEAKVDDALNTVDDAITINKVATPPKNSFFSYLKSKVSSFFGGTSSSSSSLFEGTLPTTPEGIESALSVVQKQLSTIRSDHSKETSNLRTLEKEKSDLESNLNGSFGPDDVFAVLADRCLSTKVDKYTYEVCPYKTAKQKEGSSSIGTDLGQWQGFQEGGFSVMKFGGGSTCWQGPARSMTVTLRCGTKDALLQVQEPSRCEYTAILETPAACDQMNKIRLHNSIEEAKGWGVPPVDPSGMSSGGSSSGEKIFTPTGTLKKNKKHDEL